jgi:GST-like protein
MIELHTAPTPNGQKAMLMLEETGLEYELVLVNFGKGEQRSEEHTRLSLNQKVPAIVDTDGPGGGEYTMMESNAIIIYLAEKSGKFYPDDTRIRYDIQQWLNFQGGHIGPMFGQANHYIRFAKEDVPYAKERYHTEVLRLYSVLENRLGQSEYIGCDDYSIADIASYSWTKGWETYDFDLDEHPNFKRWLTALEARPAVQKVNSETARIRAEIQASA